MADFRHFLSILHDFIFSKFAQHPIIRGTPSEQKGTFMTIKIKNFCFVGIAAAMLSATAANAAQRTRTEGSANVVTSQKYTESRYEYLSDKVGTTPAADSGLWDSEDAYPSMKTLTGAIDALEESIGGDTAKQPAVDGKIMVGTLTGTNGDVPDWTGMNDAVKEKSGGYIDITDEAGNTGAIELDIDSTKITSSSTLTDNSAKLAREGDVKGYADSKVEDTIDSTHNTIAPSGRAVSAALATVNSTLTNLDGDNFYTDVVDVAASGTEGVDYVPAHKEVQIIQNNLVTTTAGVADTTTNGSKLTTGSAVKGYADSKVNGTTTLSSSSTTTAPNEKLVYDSLALKEDTANKATAIVTDSTAQGYNGVSTTAFPTTGAVVEYVSDVMGDHTLPDDPTANGETCDATHPCALVNDGNGLHWVRMAQP